MEVIKNLRSPEKMIQKHFFEKHFNEAYRPLIVLANPKTYLNARFAKKDVKNQVIRADALIKYIKETDKATLCDLSNEEMLKLAEFFLKNNLPERSDYSLKYKELLEKYETEKVENNPSVEVEEKKEIKTSEEKVCPRCGEKMVLRVAKKGNNAGNKFYGCSAFPKCRYIEELSE